MLDVSENHQDKVILITAAMYSLTEKYENIVKTFHHFFL